MNLDPRSATINTELGVVIDNPPLARELIRVIEIDRIKSSYRLRLTDTANGLEWLSMDEEGDMVLTEEPDSTHGSASSCGCSSPGFPNRCCSRHRQTEVECSVGKGLGLPPDHVSVCRGNGPAQFNLQGART